MGRLFLLVIFLIGFAIFFVIKIVYVGAKAAYEVAGSVFDPSSKDENVKEIIGNCMLRVSHIMHEKYSGRTDELSMMILKLTPLVQSLILDKGYQVNSAIAQTIVCGAIVTFGHATQEEVDIAKEEFS